MRFISQLYNSAKTQADRNLVRSQLSDLVRMRGTAQKPPAPRDITVQSAPRGVFVSWSLPDLTNSNTQTITGFRIYKDDETTLYASIQDAATRQYFVETTSGSTPPNTNIFITSVNNLGAESPFAYAQGKAIAEAGAPSMPSSPPGYTGTGGNPKQPCFSGPVEVMTPEGYVAFENLPNPCKIVNDFGEFDADVIVHPSNGVVRVIELATHKFVTLEHYILRDIWVKAEDAYQTLPQRKVIMKLYNLHVRTENPNAQCYRIFNGDVAHNIKAAPLEPGPGDV